MTFIEIKDKCVINVDYLESIEKDSYGRWDLTYNNHLEGVFHHIRLSDTEYDKIVEVLQKISKSNYYII